MQENNNVHLNDMQIMMLNMMRWFHDFCCKNNIRYYVVGGTMLGTIRHGGFIPWDDDIDVGIPRADYNRLLANKKTWFADECRYTLESYLDGNKDFEYAYAKLYDTSTTLIENKRTKPKRGLFIDVFPLDGIGESREDAVRNFNSIKHKLDLLTVRSCAVRRGRALRKNLLICIMQLVPCCLYNNHRLIKEINDDCELHGFDESIFVGNLVGNWREKELMPRTYFGNPTLYKFENIEVYGPENFDDYLTCIYNNWRQLPSKEKQKSEHDFLMVDLYRSFYKN